MNDESKTNVPPGESAETGTMERILLAARTEFAQHGLAGARVDRIAESAHVNKAMLYYHFHSKDDLYLGVIRDYFSHVAERLRQQTDPQPDVEQFLLAVAESHRHLVTTMPDFLPIFLRELAEPREEVLECIVQAIVGSRVPSMGRERFRSEMESGKIRPLDMRQAIISFIAMSLGYYLMSPVADRIWSITDRERFLAERPRAIVDIFLNGVRPRR
ncbi:MAG: TetR/AcrR family transcriptional regulator [Candidatus Zixiibacteriota bacterium]